MVQKPRKPKTSNETHKIVKERRIWKNRALHTEKELHGGFGRRERRRLLSGKRLPSNTTEELLLERWKSDVG